MSWTLCDPQNSACKSQKPTLLFITVTVLSVLNKSRGLTKLGFGNMELPVEAWDGALLGCWRVWEADKPLCTSSQPLCEWFQSFRVGHLPLPVTVSESGCWWLDCVWMVMLLKGLSLSLVLNQNNEDEILGWRKRTFSLLSCGRMADLGVSMDCCSVGWECLGFAMRAAWEVGACMMKSQESCRCLVWGANTCH